MARLTQELDKAVNYLNDGHVIAHATEAIFGLAARALDYEACKRVWKIKNRPFKKKFIIIFSSIDEVRKYSIINPKNEQKIEETWPGHTTWVLKSTQICPFWLKDANGTLAVRVTKHGQMLSLIERCGPLVSTSANLSGSPPAKDFREAIKALGGNSLVSYILPGETCGKTRPSAIYDGSTNKKIRA